MARKKHDMINEVLAHFDFEKVQIVMKALNWKWTGTGIPNIKEIKESAEHHMYAAIEQVLDPNNTEHHDIGWISASGGLKAMAWKNEDGELTKIQLEFIIADWDAEND
jgi:hypothetical protein